MLRFLFLLLFVLGSMMWSRPAGFRKLWKTDDPEKADQRTKPVGLCLMAPGLGHIIYVVIQLIKQ